MLARPKFFLTKKRRPKIFMTKKRVTKNMAGNVLVLSTNDNNFPLLDAEDQLHLLKVIDEGIQLPTIVVVGDQSSGKTSLLESLAGISLPHGKGICTRVPLVMRLQGDPDAIEPLLHLEYHNKTVPTTEARITEAINEATIEIAGAAKGISDAAITLVVKKKGVPDLTLVDLPGITRVPVQGQPEDIYEQISNIIMGYIAPKESIILNVLSATVDFSTCESIRMSQKVDPNGERTLAVVTKSDKAPEGLLEKVTVDDVHIGLGYVCVRNRVGDETYEQARTEEERLFKLHPLLSQIDKSMTGIPVLARRLTQIQASIIAKYLPDIVKKIDEKLNRNVSDLINGMPQKLSTAIDALKTILHIFKVLRESLEKSLIKGEYDEFPDEKSLHGAARIYEMLSSYSSELPSNCPTTEDLFLMEEVNVLREAKGTWVPNFLSRSAFLVLLKRKVDSISNKPLELINAVWAYIENLTIQTMLRHLQNYPQILSSSQRVVHNLIAILSAKSCEFVKNMIEMELCADYTSNPDYMKRWAEFMEEQGNFMEVIEVHSKKTKISLKAFGEVEVGHLRSHADMAEQAFDVRMRLTAYWKFIVLRLVDGVARHILHSIKNMVERELEDELINELVGPKMAGVERMLEESPAIATKRDRLVKIVKLLRQSKEIVADEQYRYEPKCWNIIHMFSQIKLSI